MCQFKSAVVDRTGQVYMHDLTDSHSDLIELFDLPNDDADALQCVEFVPADDRVMEFDAYVFKLDNERCSWWTPEIQESVMSAMTDWLKARVVLDDGKEHLIIGKLALAAGDARVRAQFARVKACGNASVEAYDNASVKAYDNASVKACGNASVKACTCGYFKGSITRP